MNDNFESSLGQVSEEMLKYIGVTNLDFRTSLSKDDLEEVQRLLFSMNTLMQVTFKDGDVHLTSSTRCELIKK